MYTISPPLRNQSLIICTQMMREYPLAKRYTQIVSYKSTTVLHIMCTNSAIMQVPNVVLGMTMTKKVSLDSTDQLGNQMQKYFALVYVNMRYRLADLCSQIDAATLVCYGHFHLASDGDSICTKKSLNTDPLAHDNSFVKVCTTLHMLP
jgi:hypothetical protein